MSIDTYNSWMDVISSAQTEQERQELTERMLRELGIIPQAFI